VKAKANTKIKEIRAKAADETDKDKKAVTDVKTKAAEKTKQIEKKAKLANAVVEKSAAKKAPTKKTVA